MDTKTTCKTDLDNLRAAPMYAKNLDAIDYVEARLDRVVILIDETLRTWDNRSDRDLIKAKITVHSSLTEDEHTQYIVMATRRAVEVIILNGPRTRKGETWAEYVWLDTEFETVVGNGLAVMTDQAMLQFLADRGVDDNGWGFTVS